ncbi:MAG: hypothetical protein OHK0013_35170 [Sandaracinaceae bacterium]
MRPVSHDAARVTPTRPIALAAALIALAWVACAPAAAGAQAIVRVRAETRIELDAWREGSSLVVRGTVRDDAGAPVAARRVLVHARNPQGTVVASGRPQTDAAGRFEVRALTPEVTLTVEAELPDEADLVGSAARVLLDRARAHVVLVIHLAGGNRISLDEAALQIEVIATSASGGADLPIRIENELGTTIAEGRTDGAGRLAARVDPQTLGPPAAGRLVVRSSGDESRSPAQTEVPIVRFRATELAWRDEHLEIRPGTVVRAQLRTSEGPLARRAVGVFAGGAHVATRLTGEDGQVAVPLDPAAFNRSGAVEITARFDSDAPWLASSVSPPRRLALSAAPRALPFLVSASLVAAALGGWCLGRRPALGTQEVVRPSVPGVAAGRTIARRACVRAIDGRVVHAGTDEALADVTVSCGSTRTTTDAMGSFSLDLAEGTHTVVVELPGYERLEQRVTVPHRGEWRGMIVRLESRRDLASRLVRAVLSPHVPPDAIATATDRELLAVARGARRPEVVALVDAAERVVYGEVPPGREDLERLQALAERADSALAPRVDGGSTASL